MINSRKIFLTIRWISFLVLLTLGCAPAPSKFKVAFIGDQGLSPNSQAVLRLIKNEGADMVLHLGDLDYKNDPAAHEKMVNDILGRNFPYFVTVGNHDLDAWREPNGYQKRLEDRLKRIGVSWEGDLGVKSSLKYGDIFMLLVAPGTIGSDHAEYIKDKLESNNSIWRICCWHKNQNKMQVGRKNDETGWDVYEECRKGGAIIATAHEHSYSRTYLLDNIQTQSVASASDTLIIRKGQTFVFVSGLGGYSIRKQWRKPDDPWWASIYTSDQGANYGALFCVFNKGGDKKRAHCYYKDIDGKVPDEFDIISELRGQ